MSDPGGQDADPAAFHDEAVFGEVLQGRLRRSVGHGLRQAAVAGHAGHQADVAEALRDQHGQHGVEQVQRADVVDLQVPQQFVEVEVAGAGGRGTVLLPVNFSRIGGRRVVVDSIMGRDFAKVPQTRDADVVTLLEEEKIMAYYGGGTLYADPNRAEPLL